MALPQIESLLSIFHLELALAPPHQFLWVLVGMSGLKALTLAY